MENVPSWWYKLLHPRPAYIIAAAHGDKRSIMAASWVMPVSEEPPRLALAIDTESYTYVLIRESGYFSVNILFADELDKIWRAGTISGHDVEDKPSVVGLDLIMSDYAPIVRGAVAAIVSRVWKTISLGDTDLVIGDVLKAELFREDAFDKRYGWRPGKAPIPMHLAAKGFVLPGKLVIAR